MPKLDRALYAFAATMILLAVVGHTVFLTPHGANEPRTAPNEPPMPHTTTFEGSLLVQSSVAITV